MTGWNLGLPIGIFFIIGSLFSTLDYATLKAAIAGATDNIYWISLPLLLCSLEPVVKSAQIPLYHLVAGCDRTLTPVQH
jgi:NADH-quinone oxidoreductase subunit L